MRTYMLLCVSQRISSLNIHYSKNCFGENIMKKMKHAIHIQYSVPVGY
jgi:hypothetical protein